MALDFGGTKIAVATADRSATPIHQLRIETRHDDGAEEVIRRALVAARSLVDETARSGRRRTGRRRGSAVCTISESSSIRRAGGRAAIYNVGK